MSLATFYAEARWGDQWNLPRPDGSRHRGHDIKAAADTPVPALRSGVVAALGRSSVLGAYTVVKVGAAFDFYCHLIRASRPGIGSTVTAGQTVVGKIAGADDDPGSAWTGPHLHYGSGASVLSVTTGPTSDATAIVRGALATLDRKGDPDMPELFHKQGSSPTLYALAGASPGTPANWRETTGTDLATKWAQKYGNSILLSAGTWDAWRAQFLAPLTVAADLDVDTLAGAVADNLADRLKA